MDPKQQRTTSSDFSKQGSEQAERIKAELSTRRRTRGESLQELYQDISCLMELGYPSADALLTTCIAKEAFVIALDDACMQIEIRKREPRNTEEALSHAVKIDEQYVMLQSVELEDGHPGRSTHCVSSAADLPGTDTAAVL